MRRAAKVDRNQAEIVAALRGIGATVLPLHAVGKGCPDILCGWNGFNYLIEVKDWQAPKSDRVLTPAQAEWHAGWKGSVAVVETVDAALAVVTGLPLQGTIT
jgi:hypothetical protein